MLIQLLATIANLIPIFIESRKRHGINFLNGAIFERKHQHSNCHGFSCSFHSLEFSSSRTRLHLKWLQKFHEAWNIVFPSLHSRTEVQAVLIIKREAYKWINCDRLKHAISIHRSEVKNLAIFIFHFTLLTLVL